MKINPAVLYAAAHDAGNAAVQSATIQPMIVQQRENPLNDIFNLLKQYGVEDGVCGFASIVVKPAHCAFAKYLKENHRGHKSYYGGVAMLVSNFNQSLQKKEAYAHAFAKTLRDAGLNAYAESRMD